MVKNFNAILILGLMSISSFAFGAELVLRDEKGPIAAKLVCSGERSEEIVQNAKTQIQDRAVESFTFTDDNQLQLTLKDGAVVDINNGATICFIGQ